MQSVIRSKKDLFPKSHGRHPSCRGFLMRESFVYFKDDRPLVGKRRIQNRNNPYISPSKALFFVEMR